MTPAETVTLTAAGALVVSLVGMAIKQKWDRAAEDRATRSRELEAMAASDRSLVLSHQQQVYLMDRRAKEELLRLFLILERRLDFMDVLNRVQTEGINQRDLDQLLCKQKLNNILQDDAIAGGFQIDEVYRWIYLILDRDVRRTLAACADIAWNWPEFETYHGRWWLAQVGMATTAARTGVDTVSALLRGDVPAELSRSVRRRIPAGESHSARRSFVLEPVELSLVRATLPSALGPA
jgi:hypothetical protein